MFSSDRLYALRAVVSEQLPGVEGAVAFARAKDFLDKEVVTSIGFPQVAFENGDMWRELGARRQERYLHGFLFFGDWYKTVLSNEDQAAEAARAAMRIVTAWVVGYSDPNLAPSMAYHDETTAQRLMSLVTLRPLIRNHITSESLEVLDALMLSTADLLADDEFHATGNNHGMFQDLALLYYSIMVETPDKDRSSRLFELGMRRLMGYFSTCFTADGVHVENTPTYHLMVAKQVENVRQIAEAAKHEDAPYYKRLISDAEQYAIHALMPNAVFPPISDTQQLDIGRSSARNIFRSPEFAYASSQGKLGTPPKRRHLILPNSGYAIYRSSWGDLDATFAFFTAAYNADYHKHSDDLSFFLRSNGIDLLSEAGAYGYDYKAPLTKYAYSQFAHNSLIVDGRSLPRTDPHSDQVHLESLDEREDGFTVLGTNGRYADTVHRREVRIREVDGIPEIDLTDTISSSRDHKYELLWNLGTDVVPLLRHHGFELFHNNQKQLDLRIEADTTARISVDRGKTKPRPLGWRFPTFGQSVPTNVIRIKLQGRDVEVTTKIRLRNFNYAAPDMGSQVAPLLTSGRLTYSYEPAQSRSSQKLAIIFGPHRDPNHELPLHEFKTNILHISDVIETQETNVAPGIGLAEFHDEIRALIERIAREHNIDLHDVAMFGSGIGGAAALLHGLLLPVQRIFAVCPELGSGPLTSKDKSAISPNASDLSMAISESLMGAERLPAISILSIENSENYEHAVKPLIQLLAEDREGEGKASLTLLSDRRTDELQLARRSFFSAHLHQWTQNKNEEVIPYKISATKTRRGFTLALYSGNETKFAYRLYRDKEVVSRGSYTSNRYFAFNSLEVGRYRLRIFSRDGPHAPTRAFTTHWVTVVETSLP